MSVIEQYSSQIATLCKSHSVKSLYAFGSALTSKFNTQSDIDFIVDFEKIDVNNYADNYFDLKFSLQSIFNRNIDLLETNAITNPYFLQSIDSQKMLMYGFNSPNNASL